MRRRDDERGTVTAEAALVLPALVVVAVALVWLVSLTVTQVRLVDAARETARAVARGEDTGAGVALGRRVAPHGTALQVRSGRDSVVVGASVRVHGPGRLLALLPAVTLRAEAVAAPEPGSETGGLPASGRGP